MTGPEKETKTLICDNKSVGTIIRKGKDILLIERKRFPFGFAPPAGHIDDKGSFENAAKEETEEEVGLNPLDIKLLIEGIKENPCRRAGGNWHYWKIYEVKVKGNIKRSEDETKQAGWYSQEKIKRLAEKTRLYLDGKIPEVKWRNSPGLEPVWYEWFQKLGII